MDVHVHRFFYGVRECHHNEWPLYPACLRSGTKAILPRWYNCSCQMHYVWMVMNTREWVTINKHTAYAAVKCLWHYSLRGMWFMIVYEYVLAVSSEWWWFKWIQKSALKSRNPLEIQKPTLKSRNPLWNPEIHSETWNPCEIQWISKSRILKRTVADPSDMSHQNAISWMT